MHWGKKSWCEGLLLGVADDGRQVLLCPQKQSNECVIPKIMCGFETSGIFLCAGNPYLVARIPGLAPSIMRYLFQTSYLAARCYALRTTAGTRWLPHTDVR